MNVDESMLGNPQWSDKREVTILNNQYHQPGHVSVLEAEQFVHLSGFARTVQKPTAIVEYNTYMGWC